MDNWNGEILEESFRIRKYLKIENYYYEIPVWLSMLYGMEYLAVKKRPGIRHSWNDIEASCSYDKTG